MQIERAKHLVGIIVGANFLAAPLWLGTVIGADPAGKNGDVLDSEPIVVTPDELEWAEGPPSVPPGAHAVVIEGDPGVAGEVFVLRLRFPANYTLPPHTHPADERVTVVSGALNLGMGRTLDRTKGRTLPAGSQFLMPPGHAHYVWTEDEEVVIQLTSIGPWAIEYVNPDDDPRGGNGL